MTSEFKGTVSIVMESPPAITTGGLLVQARATHEALVRNGVRSTLFDWSAKTPADIYHFVGFRPYLRPVAEQAARHGRPYVISLLMGNELSAADMLTGRLRRALRLLAGGYDEIAGAARLIALTRADANMIQRFYGVSEDKVCVVPNGVDDRFFSCRPEAWTRAYGDNPFVLCVGAVQRRKQQLLLVQACNRSGLPLVLLGPVLPDAREDNYAREVADAMEKNSRYGGRWVKHLTNDDELLASAYAACSCFVLLSSRETQPLSLLQAMACSKPALALDAAYLKDEVFAEVRRINSLDLDHICSGIMQIIKQQTVQYAFAPPRWDKVAEQLASIYRAAAGGDIV